MDSRGRVMPRRTDLMSCLTSHTHTEAQLKAHGLVTHKKVRTFWFLMPMDEAAGYRPCISIRSTHEWMCRKQLDTLLHPQWQGPITRIYPDKPIAQQRQHTLVQLMLQGWRGESYQTLIPPKEEPCPI